jgi:CheY-like chemotaxis protein
MSHSPLHILLVEDNQDHAELVRRQLQRLPVAVRIHHVEDGESAVAYVFGQDAFAQRDQFPLPDLVLLDLRLPRMNGLEVLRCLKSTAATAALRVLVLTTSDAEQDGQSAYELGADDFLTKPTDLLTLQKIFGRLGFIPCPTAVGIILSRDSLQP